MEVNQDKYANLTTGYDNAATENGNITAESVFEQVLPNVVAAKSNELFALARKSSLWTLAFGLAFATILTLIVTPSALMLKENIRDASLKGLDIINGLKILINLML